MIAAVALARGLPVHTSNPDDFQGIDGLAVIAIPPPLPRGSWPVGARFYSVAEVAAILGLSSMIIHCAIADGEFPTLSHAEDQGSHRGNRLTLRVEC